VGCSGLGKRVRWARQGADFGVHYGGVSCRDSVVTGPQCRSRSTAHHKADQGNAAEQKRRT